MKLQHVKHNNFCNFRRVLDLSTSLAMSQTFDAICYVENILKSIHAASEEMDSYKNKIDKLSNSSRKSFYFLVADLKETANLVNLMQKTNNLSECYKRMAENIMK